MNKVIMMGRIANDLELKTTSNGTAVCTFRLAVNRNYQKKGEEKVTDFFNITCWRSTAEFVTQYFDKGRMILVEGEMQTRQYTDKNGNSATWYEVVAWNVFFTGEKRESGSNAPVTRGNAQAGNYTPSTQNTATQAYSATDDDYPF